MDLTSQIMDVQFRMFRAVRSNFIAGMGVTAFQEDGNHPLRIENITASKSLALWSLRVGASIIVRFLKACRNALLGGGEDVVGCIHAEEIIHDHGIIRE